MNDFFRRSRHDARIGAVHISMYVSLLELWQESGMKPSLFVFSYEVMPLCKISASSTYYKTIRQLDEYGYLKYTASYNHFVGSVVCFDSN